MPSHATGISHHQLQQQTQFKTSNKDPYLGLVGSCNWGYIGYDYTYTYTSLYLPMNLQASWDSLRDFGCDYRLNSELEASSAPNRDGLVRISGTGSSIWEIQRLNRDPDVGTKQYDPDVIRPAWGAHTCQTALRNHDGQSLRFLGPDGRTVSEVLRCFPGARWRDDHRRGDHRIGPSDFQGCGIR